MQTTSAPPIEFERRIPFADLDIVGILYTGQLLNYCVEAIDEFYHTVFGEGWIEFVEHHKLAMPFVNVNIDFKRPVLGRKKLLMRVSPVRLGNTSVTFLVQGLQDGEVCFEGKGTCVFSLLNPISKIAPPDWYAEKLAPWLG